MTGPNGPLAVASIWALAGFVGTCLLTWPLVGWLRAHGLGKTIRADGPDHAAKAGTPTMGGMGMVATTLAAGLVASWSTGSSVVAGALLTAAAFAVVGLVDDLAGLGRLGLRESGIGVSARAMFAVEIGIAFGFAIAFLPGAPVWYRLLAVLVIVGTATGVNLSDGLDGLAAGLLVAAFTGMAVVEAIRAGGEAGVPVLVLACAAGAAAGFLVFNRHPARVFMGNVASLSLGALLGAIAMTTGSWALLAIVGAVFAAEVLSDVIQIGYFRATGGRRFFRIAPLHHHFEKGGMAEQSVVRRFWTAGAACAAAGAVLAYLIWEKA